MMRLAIYCRVIDAAAATDLRSSRKCATRKTQVSQPRCELTRSVIKSPLGTSVRYYWF